MKKLKIMIGRKGGRDTDGHVSVRQRGGGSKRFLRVIDFKRDKKDVVGRVETIEKDPNRNVDIASILYQDGQRRYILAPLGIEIGNQIVSGEEAEVRLGNCLSLKNIPIGTSIHNLESTPGKGGELVRGAGTAAVILSKEANYAQVKLPSGEIKLFPLSCLATIGQLGNIDQKLKKLKKAGDNRHRGNRPKVRGVAQDPHSHPHGGGEGRSGIGMPGPKTRWGKRMGKNTRSKSHRTNKLIIKKRK